MLAQIHWRKIPQRLKLLKVHFFVHRVYMVFFTSPIFSWISFLQDIQSLRKTMYALLLQLQPSTLGIHVCYLQHQLPESSTPAFSMILFLCSCLRVFFQFNFKYIFLNVKVIDSVILIISNVFLGFNCYTHTYPAVCCSHLYSFRIEFLALDNLSGSSLLRRLILPP